MLCCFCCHHCVSPSLLLFFEDGALCRSLPPPLPCGLLCRLISFVASASSCATMSDSHLTTASCHAPLILWLVGMSPIDTTAFYLPVPAPLPLVLWGLHLLYSGTSCLPSPLPLVVPPRPTLIAPPLLVVSLSFSGWLLCCLSACHRLLFTCTSNSRLLGPPTSHLPALSPSVHHSWAVDASNGGILTRSVRTSGELARRKIVIVSLLVSPLTLFCCPWNSQNQPKLKIGDTMLKVIHKLRDLQANCRHYTSKFEGIGDRVIHHVEKSAPSLLLICSFFWQIPSVEKSVPIRIKIYWQACLSWTP